MTFFKASIFSFFLILLSWLSSCAVQSSPEGGFKDRDAPKLDTAASTPNLTVNTKPKEIVLQFDEFVQIRNASKEVVVTPKLAQGRPKLRMSGKKVVVDLSNAEWRDNTTYQIQFGEAISDLNEGNIAQNLKYVFSTGDKLDSLTLSCSTKTRAGETIPTKLKAGLYVTNDTANNSKPYYHSVPEYIITAKGGKFNFDFLSPGSYHLLVFEDTNNNAKYDAGKEQVAFLDEPVNVSELDSALHTLQLSKAEIEGKLLEVLPFMDGFWGFRFNQNPKKSWFPTSISNKDVMSYSSGDTLFLNSTELVDTLKSFSFNLNGKLDTVPIVFLPRVDTTLKLVKNGVVDPVKGAVTFSFNRPIKQIDTSKISLKQDTISFNKGEWTIDELDERTVKFSLLDYLQTAKDDLNNLKIILAPNIITDKFGTANQDTIKTSANLKASKRFGIVELKLDSLTFIEENAYYTELISADKKVTHSVVIKPNMEAVIWNRVSPGQYQLRLTVDKNNDGFYTPGSIASKRQPEPSFLLTMEEVRANWAIEYQVKVPKDTLTNK